MSANDDARAVPKAPRVALRDEPTGSGPTCARILRALPQWFGIPESVRDYVEQCDRTASTIASIGNDDVGILNLLDHGPYAAEVRLMAVMPEHHRRGIGRALLDHAESSLTRRGVEYLQVKTLSATSADRGYARTRAFYLACGFRPLEELPTLWGTENPALQMVKALRRDDG